MDDAFVGQLMSSPVLTIEPDTTAAAAGEAMLEGEIKSVVVIDADCYAEGILTSTDFVAMAADERDPTETTVGDYMTTDIVTTDAGASIAEVARAMDEHDISHVPVVDAHDQVDGMITATDLTAYLSGFGELAGER